MPKDKKPKVAHAPVVTKQPRTASTPQPQKTPRAQAPPMVLADYPSWRLTKLDFDGPWCWKHMQADDLQRVVERLQAFESMTWQDILVTARKENHPIAVGQLSKAAQDRLVAIKLDDVDDVISLRVTGRERVIGVRFGSILRLLWWDPRHEVCPSKKKHT